MPFANEDPTFARRALAHALADYLDGDRVQQAVALWSGEFEGRGSLFVGLSRYCRRVAKAFGLDGKEAELHLRIFRALQADGAALPGDPLQPPTMAAGANVVEALFRAVEACVASDPAARGLRRALLVQVRSLEPALQPPLTAWWSDPAARLIGDWPAGGLGTRLVNVIYVALADCLGPARADQVFTEAVGQLERSADADQRGIRRYL